MDINNFTEYEKSIQKKLSMCNFDAKAIYLFKMKIVPTKNLSISSVLAPCVVQKIKAIISGK